MNSTECSVKTRKNVANATILVTNTFTQTNKKKTFLLDTLTRCHSSKQHQHRSHRNIHTFTDSTSKKGRNKLIVAPFPFSVAVKDDV